MLLRHRLKMEPRFLTSIWMKACLMVFQLCVFLSTLSHLNPKLQRSHILFFLLLNFKQFTFLKNMSKLQKLLLSLIEQL